MARRKINGEAEAAALLREWRAESVDFKVFCKERGVDGRSLQCWRMNFAKREPEPVRLLELTLPPEKVAASYRIHLGELTLEVDDNFREDTLARLLTVVGRC
jgi:hypothetical protein